MVAPLQTFKGIDNDAVPAAKAAISTYITELETYLAKISQSDFSKAFKGQYAVTLKNFVSIVAANTKSVLAELKTFDTKLEEASKRYTAKDAQMASNIASAAGTNSTVTPGQ